MKPFALATVKLVTPALMSPLRVVEKPFQAPRFWEIVRCLASTRLLIVQSLPGQIGSDPEIRMWSPAVRDRGKYVLNTPSAEAHVTVLPLAVTVPLTVEPCSAVICGFPHPENSGAGNDVGPVTVAAFADPTGNEMLNGVPTQLWPWLTDRHAEIVSLDVSL